jgi:phosphoglycolate phosphatase-like HAD superfamily hydrolase
VTHLVWDWNGTLLDDFGLVLAATNVSLASVGGPRITAADHRRDFRRPVLDYYAHVLGRPVDVAEFERLNAVFHDAYRTGLHTCRLATDALLAIDAWPGTQSLLSMFMHDELTPLVRAHGLARRFRRVDGLRDQLGGGAKEPYLAAHLAALGLTGPDCVLIGDSVDDATAAAAVGARAVLYGQGFTDAGPLRETRQPVARSLLEAVDLAWHGAAVVASDR